MKDEKSYDIINKAAHYNKHPSGIECIDVVEHFNFNLGNVIKYIWRADFKDYDIQDLSKAAYYLQREIKRRKVNDKVNYLPLKV